MDVGAQGISVIKLAKHVYNHNCTLFYKPDFKQVHRSVQQFLTYHSRSPKGMVERTERWGHYRLNTRNAAAQKQLKLQFSDKEEAEPAPSKQPAPDLSLSLFD